MGQNNNSKDDGYETLCKECQGLRGRYEGSDWYECPECDGSGWIPNEYGEKLLKLVEHHVGRILAAKHRH